MSSCSPTHLAIAFLAAFVAGGINSVAGGGTLISFPVLIALGLPPSMANATSTVGIWPGAVGSGWGFRRELGRILPRVSFLLLPAAVGGGVGALMLWRTPAGLFERLVPGLILLATFLFIVQAPVQRRLKSVEAAALRGKTWIVTAFVLQLLVAIYGGYFGAGMSIVNLSILAMLGMTDILEMNGMTSLVALAINGVAGGIFIAKGMVHWPSALAMMLGALAGGYGAAGVARKIGKLAVKKFVIAVGLILSVAMTWRMLSK